MVEMFRAGGWGMFPTLAAGLFMLAMSVRYAARPSPRQIPVLVTLGLLTLCSGALGFVTGIIATTDALGGLAGQRGAAAGPSVIALMGMGESAHNLALALALATAAMLAVVVGAWRLAGGANAAPALGRS